MPPNNGMQLTRPAAAQLMLSDMWQMMNQMMGAWGTGMMWLNFLTGVLFLVLLIVGIVAGAKWLFAEGS